LSPDLWWWLCGCPGGKIPLVASTSCACSHSRVPGGVYVSIFSDSRGAFEPTLGRRFRISAAKSTPSCFLEVPAKCEPFVLSLPFTVARLLLGGLGKASMGSGSGEGAPINLQLLVSPRNVHASGETRSVYSQHPWPIDLPPMLCASLEGNSALATSAHPRKLPESGHIEDVVFIWHYDTGCTSLLVLAP